MQAFNDLHENYQEHWNYIFCDKGSVERHNGLIRRFIPKGDRIDNYTLQEVIDIET